MTTPIPAEILMGQRQVAARLRGIFADVLKPILDDAADAKQRIESMKDVDQAVGVWLDRL